MNSPSKVRKVIHTTLRDLRSDMRRGREACAERVRGQKSGTLSDRNRHAAHWDFLRLLAGHLGPESELESGMNVVTTGRGPLGPGPQL